MLREQLALLDSLPKTEGRRETRKKIEADLKAAEGTQAKL